MLPGQLRLYTIKIVHVIRKGLYMLKCNELDKGVEKYFVRNGRHIIAALMIAVMAIACIIPNDNAYAAGDVRNFGTEADAATALNSQTTTGVETAPTAETPTVSTESGNSEGYVVSERNVRNSEILTDMRGVWVAFVDYKNMGLYNKSETVFRANASKMFKNF